MVFLHCEFSYVSPCGTFEWTSFHTRHSEKAFPLNINNSQQSLETTKHTLLQPRLLFFFICHSPVWIFSCRWRRYFWMNRISHWLQWNGFSPGIWTINNISPPAACCQHRYNNAYRCEWRRVSANGSWSWTQHYSECRHDTWGSGRPVIHHPLCWESTTVEGAKTCIHVADIHPCQNVVSQMRTFAGEHCFRFFFLGHTISSFAPFLSFLIWAAGSDSFSSCLMLNCK